jgi:Domain of unknown function (DUF1992)
MTERKPAGMRFETWVERQIREAQERGEFDNLRGAGEPLPGLTGHYDEMWWVKQVAQREHLSLLPPLLALRREAEELLAGLGDLQSEAAVRDVVADYNARVVDAIRGPHDGPLVAVPRRLDVDQVVAEWRRRRSTCRPAAVDLRPTMEDPTARRPRRRWWTGLIRRRR